MSMNKLRNNLITLGAIALFFVSAHVSYAAYVCEPFAIQGTEHFITRCYNTDVYNNSYRSSGGKLGDSNESSGFGAPLGYSGGNTYYGNNYGNTGNSGSNSGVTNTYSSNGVNPNSNTVSQNTSTKSTTVNRQVASTTTTNKTINTSNTANANNNDTVNTTNVSNARTQGNGLTALSLQGSNSFMPDTVWEWICVFFLILIIIILIRQFRPNAHGGHSAHSAPHH